MTKAPLGQDSMGKTTDRSTSGTKRSLLIDSDVILVGVAIEGANSHDICLRR